MIYFCINEDFNKTYYGHYEISADKLLIDIYFENVQSDPFSTSSKGINVKTISIIDFNLNVFIKTFRVIEYRSKHFLNTHTLINTYLSTSYFTAKDVDDLMKLKSNLKVDNLMIYHECLDNLYRNNLKFNDLTKCNRINGYKHEDKDLNVNKDNIKSALIRSERSSSTLNNGNKICIEYFNILIVTFKNNISVLDVNKYKQFITFMFNIYYSKHKPIYCVKFECNNKTYEFHSGNLLYKPNHEIDYNAKVQYKIDDFVCVFLNTKSIKDTDTNLFSPFDLKNNYYAEQLFLEYFKFIENHKIKSNKISVEQGLKKLLSDKDNKELLHLLGIKYNPDLHLFIETLRNHYVHEGFYIENDELEIKNCHGLKMIVTNEMIINYLKLTKALTYKIILNDILSLKITNKNISAMV